MLRVELSDERAKLTKSATLPTRFTERYGVKYPIAAAGMAFVTLTPRLPVAVAEAGALGSFAAGILPVEVVRQNVQAIRQQTDKLLNVNIITLFGSDEHIDMCIDEQVDIVSFHWQHPKKEWISRLQEAGINVWEQVGNADAARRALDDGIELIIAQGSEAGGHCYGHLPTFVAVPSIVDAADGALVLAAGGISDGRGLAAALALGADGAWVGTRLLATEESEVADQYKNMVVDAQATDTTLTSMFGSDLPEFNPMRVISNRIVTDWHHRQSEISEQQMQEVVGSMDFLGQEMELKKFASLMPIQGSEGDFEQMALPVGQGLGVIHDILPAQKVIEQMMSEAVSVIQGINSR